MRSTRFSTTIVAIAVIGLVASVGPAAADNSKLVKSLSGDLGISEEQAIGGTKALLDVAKGNLGEEQFGKLLDGNPDLGDLMQGDRGTAKATAKAKAEGAKGKLKGKVGKAGDFGSLAGNADLIKQFTDLGMDAGMVEKFAGQLLDLVGGGGPGSGLSSSKTALLREGLGIL